MKTLITSIITLSLLIVASLWYFQCNAQEENVNKTLTASPQKILIAYYSWGGNTREIANQIKNLTGGDLVEIIPAVAYPTDYQPCVDQAKKEIKENFMPAIKAQVENIADYDVIFIGSPNWWSTIAPPVATFLTTHNLAGKNIVPFVTHGGGGIGRCETDIIKHCPQSTVLKTLYLSGSSVKSAQPEVEKYLKNIGAIK